MYSLFQLQGPKNIKVTSNSTSWFMGTFCYYQSYATLGWCFLGCQEFASLVYGVFHLIIALVLVVIVYLHVCFSYIYLLSILIVSHYTGHGFSRANSFYLFSQICFLFVFRLWLFCGDSWHISYAWRGHTEWISDVSLDTSTPHVYTSCFQVSTVQLLVLYN